MSTEPEWLKRARADIGVKEIPGPVDNARILAMYRTVGHPEVKSEETAWCAAGMGTWLKESGYPIPPKANNLMAMSYETYGRAMDEFEPGAICVFYRGRDREKSWQRHVAIGVREDAKYIWCIGGNQSDSVSEKKLPKADLVAMRWPVKASVAELRDAGSSDIATADTIKRVAMGAVGVAGAGSAASESTESVPAITIETVADNLSLWQQLMEGANAVAAMVGKHPWLLAGAVIGLGMYVVAKRIERKRVARAEAGHTLSVEG